MDDDDTTLVPEVPEAASAPTNESSAGGDLRPVPLAPFKIRKVNSQTSMAEWRQAMAGANSPHEKVAIFRVLTQMALAGNMAAITLILQYSLGKPGVGQAGKMVDDAVADELEVQRFKKLPPAKQRQYLELVEEMNRADQDDDQPLTLEANAEPPVEKPTPPSSEDLGEPPQRGPEPR